MGLSSRPLNCISVAGIWERVSGPSDAESTPKVMGLSCLLNVDSSSVNGDTSASLVAASSLLPSLPYSYVFPSSSS